MKARAPNVSLLPARDLWSSGSPLGVRPQTKTQTALAPHPVAGQSCGRVSWPPGPFGFRPRRQNRTRLASAGRSFANLRPDLKMTPSSHSQRMTAKDEVRPVRVACAARQHVRRWPRGPRDVSTSSLRVQRRMHNCTGEEVWDAGVQNCRNQIAQVIEIVEVGRKNLRPDSYSSTGVCEPGSSWFDPSTGSG